MTQRVPTPYARTPYALPRQPLPAATSTQRTLHGPAATVVPQARTAPHILVARDQGEPAAPARRFDKESEPRNGTTLHSAPPALISTGQVSTPTSPTPQQQQHQQQEQRQELLASTAKVDGPIAHTNRTEADGYNSTDEIPGSADDGDDIEPIRDASTASARLQQGSSTAHSSLARAHAAPVGDTAALLDLPAVNNLESRVENKYGAPRHNTTTPLALGGDVFEPLTRDTARSAPDSEDLSVQVRRATRRIQHDNSIRDSVHNMLSLSVALWDVIATVEFQRLRDIKQLGVQYLVFAGATHSRFEHSLGTCHLAGRWMEHFREQQRAIRRRASDMDARINNLLAICRSAPQNSALALSVAARISRTRAKMQSLATRFVAIDDDDVFLVQMAALCHDMGHGPFSHCFETLVNESGARGEIWHHEAVSCALLRRINERTHILTDQEVDRVEHMIRGVVAEPERAFLYRIVNNARNSIDVDKFDYLARDCQRTGVRVGCDFERIIAASRLERGEICFDKRDYHGILQLFRVRLYMHREVYLHPTVKAAELMIGDALRAAEGVLGIFSAIDRGDCDHFVACTDALLGEIRRRALSDPALAEAAALIARIDARDFYRHVGDVRVPPMAGALDRVRESLRVVLDERGIAHCARMLSHTLDFAMGDLNPLRCVPFYESEWDGARAGGNLDGLGFEAGVPEVPHENIVRIYAVERARIDDVRQAVDSWSDTFGQLEGYRFVVSPKLRFK